MNVRNVRTGTYVAHWRDWARKRSFFMRRTSSFIKHSVFCVCATRARAFVRVCVSMCACTISPKLHFDSVCLLSIGTVHLHTVKYSHRTHVVTTKFLFRFFVCTCCVRFINPTAGCAANLSPHNAYEHNECALAPRKNKFEEFRAPTAVGVRRQEHTVHTHTILGFQFQVPSWRERENAMTRNRMLKGNIDCLTLVRHSFPRA